MQITVCPASPKTGQATIQALLDDKVSPTVQGVYRDLSKVPDRFKSNPRFKAVQGDVSDAATLDFGGSDAVLSITPPVFDGSDMIEHATRAAENTKNAIKAAGSVKRLVYVSSMGAQHDHGTGEILTNHTAETIYKDAAPEVIFVRNAYFMENWASAVATVKSEHPFFFSTITPLNYAVPMIAVKDIGRVCAGELLAQGGKLSQNPYIFELHGPRDYTPKDVQQAFKDVAGKEVEIKPVEKNQLEQFFAQVFPPSTAKTFAEMSGSFLPGGIAADDMKMGANARQGQVELTTVIEELYKGES